MWFESNKRADLANTCPLHCFTHVTVCVCVCVKLNTVSLRPVIYCKLLVVSRQAGTVTVYKTVTCDVILSCEGCNSPRYKILMSIVSQTSCEA
jgi:hypothetical protein